jgi:hypothetical protein
MTAQISSLEPSKFPAIADVDSIQIDMMIKLHIFILFIDRLLVCVQCSAYLAF